MERIRTRRQGRSEPTEGQTTQDVATARCEERDSCDFPSEGVPQGAREKVLAEVHHEPDDQIRFETAEEEDNHLLQSALQERDCGEEADDVRSQARAEAYARNQGRGQSFVRPDLESQRQAQRDLVTALNRNQDMVASMAARARDRTQNMTGVRPRTTSPQRYANNPTPASPPLTREVLQEAINTAVRNTLQLVGTPALNQGAHQAPRRGHRDSTPRQLDESESSDDGSQNSRWAQSRSQHSPKLPPFTGKETWEVWYTRFSEVARLCSWSERRCLQEMLPRLQGTAGDFVYSQLPQEARSSFGRLVAELNSRFKVVETRKTFAAQFSSRQQHPAETAEEYAAELKRLYNKAYPGREEQTRREDLLRRFLDGLYDERSRFHIEFVKEPDSIDQAVFEVVNLAETRKRPRDKDGNRTRPTRVVKSHGLSEEDEDFEMVQPDPDSDEEDPQEERVARVPSKVNKHKKLKRPGEDGSSVSQQPTAKAENDQWGQVAQLLETLTKQISNLGKEKEDSGKVRSVSGKDESRNRPRKKTEGRCFKCGEMDHFARRCPHYRWVQVPAEEAEAIKSSAGGKTSDDKGIDQSK